MEVLPSNGRSMPCPHRTRSMQCPPRCGTCPQYVGPRKVKSKLCQQNLKKKKKNSSFTGAHQGAQQHDTMSLSETDLQTLLDEYNIDAMCCEVQMDLYCTCASVRVQRRVFLHASAFGSLLSLGLSGRTERSITKFCCKWFLGSRCRRLIMLILANYALSSAARVVVWGPHIQGCQQSRYF